MITRPMKQEVARWLRTHLPTAIKQQIARVARVIEGTSHHGIEIALERLKDWGATPGVALDVGAYVGRWTCLYRRIFPGSPVLMIEAQPGKERDLAQVVATEGPEVDYAIALLGPRDGERVRFTEMETGSSVFEESSPYPRRHVERVQQRLDSLLEGWPAYLQPRFLKLDVQGYELAVLEGAPRTLRSVELVLMEASLIPTNAGCPLFDEVIGAMAERGFSLLDICSQSRRKDGALWQADLLFARRDLRLRPDPRIGANNWV